MELQTMQMSSYDARKHYVAYRTRVRQNQTARKAELELALSTLGSTDMEERKEAERLHRERAKLDREDIELMRAYRAMAQGQRIININSVIRDSGIYPDTYLPKLAIARADWRVCHFHGHVWIGGHPAGHGFYHKTPREPGSVFLHSVLPAETTNISWRAGKGLPRYPVKAIVPSIPPHLRPSDPLSDYHILFEAVWSPAAPVDPILLKRVNTYHYAVLAQWDLTPIERSVLEGRLG